MRIESIRPTPVSPAARIAATSNRAERIKTEASLRRAARKSERQAQVDAYATSECMGR